MISILIFLKMYGFGCYYFFPKKAFLYHLECDQMNSVQLPWNGVASLWAQLTYSLGVASHDPKWKPGYSSFLSFWQTLKSNFCFPSTMRLSKIPLCVSVASTWLPILCPAQLKIHSMLYRDRWCQMLRKCWAVLNFCFLWDISPSSLGCFSGRSGHLQKPKFTLWFKKKTQNF